MSPMAQYLGIPTSELAILCCCLCALLFLDTCESPKLREGSFCFYVLSYGGSEYSSYRARVQDQFSLFSSS